MSDTTIDKILDEFIPHHAKLDNGDALVVYPETRANIKAMTKSALYELMLSVIGEDNKDVRGTTQNPNNPAYHTKRAKFKNELRAEQRNKLKELFDER